MLAFYVQHVCLSGIVKDKAYNGNGLTMKRIYLQNLRLSMICFVRITYCITFHLHIHLHSYYNRNRKADCFAHNEARHTYTHVRSFSLY